MGDLAALQYMAVETPNGCVELWNQARFEAYLQAGIGPAGWTIEASPCNGLAALLQGGDAVAPQYVDPELDDAPWYDPHPAVRTRARRFVGLLPVEVNGLDDDSQAVDVVSTIDGGAVFVNRRDVPREIAVKALLVGKDCCAVRYGLEWLKLALSDASCGGNGGELTYLSCCPPAASDIDICADSTGDCDPETDEDCVEIECEDEADVYDLSATEWWRSLIGVAPSQSVKVTNKLGADCGCGGSEVLEVQFSLVTGNPRPWRTLVTAEERVLFTESNRRPTYRFRRVPKTIVKRAVTRERIERKVVLRGNRWCPVGRWGAGEVQAFGGEGYVTVTEAVASTTADLTATQSCAGGGDQKRPHYIRLTLDESGGQLYFNTVRWVNDAWNTQDPLASVPCDTPIEIVELVRINLAGSPPVPTPVVSAPGTGDDCCFVSLQWTANNGGFWFTAPAPTEAGDASPWTQWGAEGTPPNKSGWPPVGCTLVVARNCPPTTDACPDSVDCPIILRSDGTWVPASGVTPAYSQEGFPPPQCRYLVSGQTTAPITQLVDEVVYEACPQGCEPDIDPLADPAEVRSQAPTPPLSKGQRCLPATRVEVTMEWSDNRQWDTVVPVIEFNSGRTEAPGVEILVWANPLGLNPQEPSSRDVFLDCNACGVWSLSRVPAGATIRVDGRSRKVTAILPGGQVVPAGQLLETRDNRALSWPQVDGCGLVAAVRVGANAVDYAQAYASLYVAGSGS